MTEETKIENEYIKATIKGKQKDVFRITKAIAGAIEEIKIEEKSEEHIELLKKLCNEGKILCPRCKVMKLRITTHPSNPWITCDTCREDWDLFYFINRFSHYLEKWLGA